MQIEIFDKATKETYGYFTNVENVWIEDGVLMIANEDGKLWTSYSLADFTFKGTNND